jgi:LacI family transcriptional regulator
VNRKLVEPRRKRIGMKALAAAAGVSIATVSRALRNDTRVSETVRTRIQTLAGEMGYRPDPEVSRLMTHLRKQPAERAGAVLALINTLQPRNYLRDNPNTREMLEGIQEEADRLGFQTEEFWLKEPFADHRALSRILYNRGVRGCLLLPFHRGLQQLQMDFARLSVIALGRSQAQQGAHSVVTNPFEAVRLAMIKALELGYRRPGIALESYQDQRADGRYHGAFYVCQEQLAVHDRIPPFAGSPDAHGGFREWICHYNPDVVLSYGRWVLESLKQFATAKSMTIGFIDLNRSNTDHAVMGVCQNYAEMGRTAVDLLVDLINKDERGLPRMKRLHVVDVTWKAGALSEIPSCH